MTQTTNHASQSAHSTTHIDSDARVDTDLRRFTAGEQQPFPSKLRTMRLYMPQEAEPIVLIDVDRLRIGRANGENRLDLSMQYAKMLGVSREHADISYHEGYYFVTDLSSTNGTYLNNRKLQANVPHRLEHSDQLRFGHFVAVVGFS